MIQPKTLLLLTSSYFLATLFDLIFKNFNQISSESLTILDHIQSSFISSILLNLLVVGLFLFLVILVSLAINNDYGIFITYIILLKFVPLISLLIDTINVLLIYQKYSSNSLKFILFFCLIRLIINLWFTHQNFKTHSERQILVIIDLAFFLLTSIVLIRYTNGNLITIGPQIILCLLIFQLNKLYYNKPCWSNLIEWSKSLKRFRSIKFFAFTYSMIKNFVIEFDSFYSGIIHLMLYSRRIFSRLIIYSFLWYTTLDILNEKPEKPFKFILANLLIGIVILIAIDWDTDYSLNTFREHEFARYCREFEYKQTCSVCLEDKRLDDFDGVTMLNCQHENRSVCNQCLLQHVQTAFAITFADDVSCPELQCRVRLDYDTVTNILRLASESNLIDRYNQYVSHRQLEQMDEFIWCSNPSCGNGQLNEGGALNNIVTCYKCHRKTCFIHKAPWHEGVTCETYDQNLDPVHEKSRRWIVENSKKCPNCPYQIEKNEGCDHMKCIKCKHEFCWSCLADFQLIRNDGNHRHEPTCKHYAAYDG